MADAVLSRGGTTVTTPLLQSGGSLAVARTVGKPTLREAAVGNEEPRAQDYKNAADTWTIAGLLHGPSAYSDAQSLAEDLIKPRATTGTPLQLDLSDLPNRGTYDVAPSTSNAAVLTYVPGGKELVGVQLSLSVVQETNGGSQDSQTHASPDTGTGVKLERGGSSITIQSDLEVKRKVGRPNADLHPRPDDLPVLIDKNAPASDVFEISGDFTSTSAESDALTLEETITRARLGDETITLHFLDDLFGLSAYTTVPAGTGAVRTVFETGVTGVVSVPTLNLRVVNNA